MSKLPEVPALVVGLSRIESRLRDLRDYARNEKSDSTLMAVNRLISQIDEMSYGYHTARQDINDLEYDEEKTVLKSYKRLVKPVLEWAKSQPDYKDILRDFKQLEHGWEAYQEAFLKQLKESRSTAMAAAKTHKHEASGKKFFEVSYGHNSAYVDGASIESVGKKHSQKMSCEVRPAKMTPTGLVGVGKFKKFKKTVSKATASFAFAAKAKKKETPRYPEQPALESASAALIKAKITKKYVEDAAIFKSASEADAVYLDAVGGSLPEYDAVVSALLVFSTELKEAQHPEVQKLGNVYVVEYKTFLRAYKNWLEDVKRFGSVATASDKVWVAKSPKGGNVTDPVATKALEKYIEQFGKRGKFSLYEAVRENGMVSFQRGCRMLKGTLPEIIDQLKHEAISAEMEANPRNTDVTQIEVDALAPNPKSKAGKKVSNFKKQPEKFAKNGAPIGLDQVGNAIISDLKSIKSSIKTWSEKTGDSAMSPRQLKRYLEYKNSVAGYIAKNWIQRLNKNYQAKVKAI